MTDVGTNDAPADVFGLLSDETRIDILRAIATAAGETPESGYAELTFSEIYERVDVDNTSRLSYHLGELTGPFLRKHEGGYSFTYAGERMVRFVLSENYESPPAFGPETTTGRCPFCGTSPLTASIDHRMFRVDCPDCERPIAGHPVTPAQVRTEPADALVESVRRKQASDYARLRRGLCPQCDGRLSTSIREMQDALPASERFLVFDECEACRRRYNAPLTYSVAYHPASVAFHWNHGIDVTARALWDFHEPVYEGRWWSERVEGDDDYRVVLQQGSDSLRLFLDGEATVTRTECVRRADADDHEK